MPIHQESDPATLMPNFPNWVGGSVNDELKLATLYALYSARTELNQKPLADAVHRLQGSAIPFHVATPQDYCKDDFNFAGFTETTHITIMVNYLRTVRAHRLTAAGAKQGVSLAGDLETWSAEYPNLSLLAVLGKTAYDSTRTISHTGKRLHIYQTLLASKTGLPIGHLNSEHGRTKGGDSSFSRILRELEIGKLVVQSGSHRENKRTFEILDPEYKTGGRGRPSFDKLKPEMQAMFTIFKTAYPQKPTWELDEFIRLGTLLGFDESTMSQIRYRLQNALAPSTQTFKENICEGKRASHYEEGNRYSSVTIAKEHRPAIAQLVTLLEEHIAEDPDAITRGHAKAATIFSDPEAVADLVSKSRLTSAWSNTDPEFANHLKNIVSEQAIPRTAQEVHAVYEDRHDRNVSLDTVARYLWGLYRDGKLGVKERPIINSKKSTPPQYMALAS